MLTLILAAEGAEAQAIQQKLNLATALPGPFATWQGDGAVLIETGVGKVAAAAAGRCSQGLTHLSGSNHAGHGADSSAMAAQAACGGP